MAKDRPVGQSSITQLGCNTYRHLTTTRKDNHSPTNPNILTKFTRKRGVLGNRGGAAKTGTIEPQFHSSGVGVQGVPKMRVGLIGRVEEDCQGPPGTVG